MINREEFFNKFYNSKEKFEGSTLTWEDLVEIAEDFESKRENYKRVANHLENILSECPKVHSVKKRVKNTEHLIEKIIRKSVKKGIKIDVNNYEEEINDLIGVRVLHLFKEDWQTIHREIIERWDLLGQATVNYRKGDDLEVFLENGCNIKEHKFGYRSVHYLIENRPTKNERSIVEIQVRTIFEEAWSEIDHSIRYPYHTDSTILNGYLSVFNSLAGNADDMGTFIKVLKNEIDEKNRKIEEGNEIITELRCEIEKSQMGNSQKDSMLAYIKQLDKTRVESNLSKIFDTLKTKEFKNMAKNLSKQLRENNLVISDMGIKNLLKKPELGVYESEITQKGIMESLPEISSYVAEFVNGDFMEEIRSEIEEEEKEKQDVLEIEEE